MYSPGKNLPKAITEKHTAIAILDSKAVELHKAGLWPIENKEPSLELLKSVDETVDWLMNNTIRENQSWWVKDTRFNQSFPVEDKDRIVIFKKELLAELTRIQREKERRAESSPGVKLQAKVRLRNFENALVNMGNLVNQILSLGSNQENQESLEAVRPQPPAPQPYGVSHEGAETLVRDWMLHLGFETATVTRQTSDGGIDVVARTHIAQVKNYKDGVGVSAIRELYGVAVSENKKPLFFTSGYYSTDALIFAERNGIALLIYSAEEGSLKEGNKEGVQIIKFGDLEPSNSQYETRINSIKLIRKDIDQLIGYCQAIVEYDLDSVYEYNQITEHNFVINQEILNKLAEYVREYSRFDESFEKLSFSEIQAIQLDLHSMRLLIAQQMSQIGGIPKIDGY